jgi:hypothetical protein
MKKCLWMCIGLLWAITAASPASAVVYQFDGSVDNDFLTSGNWSIPPGQTPDPGVPDDSTDRAIINDSFVVSYASSATTTLGSMIIGADWPVTGDFGTPGTLNMSDGKFIVTGPPGDSFQIGRACCAGDGAMYMSGDAELEIGGSDPIVGTRDNGLLDVGGTALVRPTVGVDNYWRLGNYGPSSDAGLEGNGVLNVHDSGTFRAHVIFIGDNDSSGTIRVDDNGQVLLTGNLVPRPSGFQAGGAAVVEMIGSSATLNAFNLESESLLGEIATKYVFEADAGGVSDIKLVDAVNITNNELVVDLNGFNLAPGGVAVLFDAAPNRIFGQFSSVSVLGGNPNYTYAVEYRNFHHGDIVLHRVPEPSTIGLIGLGLALVACGKRRASR